MQNNVISNLSERLLPYGFDIVRPFDVAAYNELAESNDRLLTLNQFGRKNTLGLLVGNSRKIWKSFVKEYNQNPDLQNSFDPLDDYAHDVIFHNIENLAHEVEMWDGPHDAQKVVSLRHVAELSGLAHISPAQLAVSEQYGFWFGLRAVIIVDAEPILPIKITKNPCQSCDGPCRQAYELALEAKNWQSWIKVRDACPIGKSIRYSDDQVNYHHSKNPEYIR